MSESNFITLSEAQSLTFAYQHSADFSEQPKALRFTKDDLGTLLNQEGAVEISFYPGLTASGKLTLVAVAVDEENQDMVNAFILNRCLPCPPKCTENSPLIDE